MQQFCSQKNQRLNDTWPVIIPMPEAFQYAAAEGFIFLSVYLK